MGSKEFTAELQDMAASDIHEFIDHWHAAVAETVRDEDEKPTLTGLAESLKSKLSKNAAIFRLATSPLLCALLCALHRQRVQNLPSDRIELYRLCIEMFMRRDEERKIDASDYIELTNRQKESLLQDFAWWMIRNGKTTATPEETVDCFQRHFNRLTHAPALGDGAAVKKLFLHRICIIRQLAHQKIDFPHRTFQEYLAAKAATEEDDLGVLVKNAHDDQWREVVILAAGLLPSKRASALIMDLLERGDTDAELHSLYLVAVAALDLLVAGDEDSALKKAVAERLNKIVPPKNLTAAAQLALAGDLVVPHLRYRKMKAFEAAASVRTLALIGTDAAHMTLEEYAKDSREGVKSSCIQSLKFGRDPNVCARIIFRHSTNLGHLDLSGSQLSDINSLTSLTKLTTLNLANTQVNDVSALASLTNLDSLDLRNTQVSDFSGLANLTKLTTLYLSNTQVSDVHINCLVSFANLSTLHLSNGKVSDLSGLANLTTLYLNNTRVSDLSSLPRLTKLFLINMQVSDVGGLANLTNLATLYLINMRLSDVSGLANLTSLSTLYLINTRMSDVSGLASLTSLTTLDLSNTQMSDISSLASLINLESLSLSNTQVDDVSCLASLASLTSLDLSNTQVSDIRSLATLTNLDSLYLSNTHVGDVSCLASLTSLTSLDLSNTQVSDIGSLATLTNLDSLYLSNTQVSDVSSLANLTSLSTLDLANTHVTDISSLAALTNLESLYLSNTQVSDVSSLANLTSLSTLDLANTSVRDLSGLRLVQGLKVNLS